MKGNRGEEKHKKLREETVRERGASSASRLPPSDDGSGSFRPALLSGAAMLHSLPHRDTQVDVGSF